MNRAKNFITLASVCAIAIINLCGCNTVKSLVDPYKARVDIPYKGDEASVEVEASADEHCIAGVGHLRNKDWQKAADELTQATSKNTKDHRAHYALGVAYEMLENLEKALEEYKSANLANDKMDYSRGVDRVVTKLKQKPAK